MPAHHRQQSGEKCGGKERGDDNHHQTANRDRADLIHRNDEERSEGDRHRRTRERDGVSRSRSGDSRCFLFGHPLEHRLAKSSHYQQCVVDAEAEAEHYHYVL